MNYFQRRKLVKKLVDVIKKNANNKQGITVVELGEE